MRDYKYLINRINFCLSNQIILSESVSQCSHRGAQLWQADLDALLRMEAGIEDRYGSKCLVLSFLWL